MTAVAARAEAGATFDVTGRYRYLLWRTWDEHLPRACFVMLNPSTADATSEDPTIRRCIAFATSHGFGGMEVVNLFAFRTTHPALLPRTAEARGIDNDEHIERAVERCGVTIAAWGIHGAGYWQALTGLESVSLHCLGVTKDGEPRHPLYVAATERIRPWTPSAVTTGASRGDARMASHR